MRKHPYSVLSDVPSHIPRLHPAYCSPVANRANFAPAAREASPLLAFWRPGCPAQCSRHFLSSWNKTPPPASQQARPQPINLPGLPCQSFWNLRLQTKQG